MAETYNHTIRMVTPAGIVTTLAGNASIVNEYGSPAGGYADGTGNAARFNSPEGLAVDDTGKVYVADTRNCTIRKITPGGEATTLAGQPASPTEFGLAAGLAVTRSGSI